MYCMMKIMDSSQAKLKLYNNYTQNACFNRSEKLGTNTGDVPEPISTKPVIDIHSLLCDYQELRVIAVLSSED